MKQSKDIIANEGELLECRSVNESEDSAAENHMNQSSDFKDGKAPRKSKGYFIVGD